MSTRNCVKKYVKCPSSKRCRVKTGRCVSRQPDEDIKYDFAGKKFYITPGEGHEQVLEDEYGVSVRRSSRTRKTPERPGIVTGSKYRKEMRRGIKREKELSRKESEIIKKFRALDFDVREDLVSAPKEDFELTVRDLDTVAGFFFPEVPIGDISPTGLSPQDLKLLKRLRALQLPLGLPPSPPKGMKGSKIKRTGDVKLDERRLALLEQYVGYGGDSDDDDGDEYVPNEAL